MDPYVDPDSGVLRNRLGIVDGRRLRAVEAGLTLAALADLSVRPLPAATTWSICGHSIVRFRRAVPVGRRGPGGRNRQVGPLLPAATHRSIARPNDERRSCSPRTTPGPSPLDMLKAEMERLTSEMADAINSESSQPGRCRHMKDN